MKTTLRYGVATSTYWFDGDVCMVELRGPMTRSALVSLNVQFQSVQHPNYDVFLLDWRRAVVATTIEEMLGIVQSLPPESTLWLPACYLVKDHQLVTFHQHCYNAIQHGLQRVTFGSSHEAEAWAQRKAFSAAARRTHASRKWKASPAL